MAADSPLSVVDSFGGIDADADELLRACFQDHPAYISVRNRRRFLVLGRKGAGKTAIYKRLIAERSPTAFALGHSFDDYPWQHHDLQGTAGVPEERRYVHSWRYLINIGLSKLLLNNDNSQPWSDDSADALSRLENFVVDSYGSRNPDLHQLFSPERKLAFNGKISLKVLELGAQQIEVKDLPRHIQDVNRAMQDAVLHALNPGIEYFVCFDQLDLGYAAGDKTYEQRLTGLLIAARDLFVAGREAGKKLNIVVFLRDDIFEDLHFEDKNKIFENFSTHLSWAEEGADLTLKALMEERFKRVIGDGNSKVSWIDVFDEGKEMPSRQSKYKHICDRTFLRPRDMIKFCNEVLVSYKSDPSAADRFDNGSIHLAREAYSSYLLRELDDEIAKHVPLYKEYLEGLKSVGSERFEFREFADVLGRRKALDGVDARDALADLFEFSIISYLKPGGRGGGSEYVWRYKDARARFDPAVESFRVHPGLKESLGLVR